VFFPVRRKTLQINEARIVSRFGWGLAKTIENHGLAKFKTNLQRVSLTSITTFTRLLTLFAVTRGAFSHPERTPADPAAAYGRGWRPVLAHGRALQGPRGFPFRFAASLCARHSDRLQ